MEIIIGIIAFVAGGGVGYIALNTAMGAQKKKIIAQAESDGELIKKERLMLLSPGAKTAGYGV